MNPTPNTTPAHTLWTLAAMLGALAAPALAQPAAVAEKPAEAHAAPKVDAKADEILDRAVEFSFGESADSLSVETVHMKGNMSMPAMGISGTLEAWLDLEAGEARVNTEIPGLTNESSGITDGVAWADSAVSGARLMSEEEAAEMRHQLDFDAEINYQDTYATREYLGMENVDGQVTHKIRLVRADDQTERTRWYASDGSVLKETSKVVSNMGIIEIVSRISDYRDIGGGAMVPFKTVNVFNGMEQILEFETVEFNADIPEDAMTPPAAVKALMD